MASELLVDWFKYAFIGKFNSILPKSFSNYYETIKVELAKTGKLSRRCGFSAVPICCLFIRTIAVDKPTKFLYFWFACLLVKIFLSKLLHSRVSNGEDKSK